MPQDDPPPLETELKFAFAPEARSKIEAHPLLANATVQDTRHQESIYYDTPDLTLGQRGFSLRVRQQDGDIIQTLKSSQPGDAVASRGEWEWTLSDATLDLSRLHETPASIFATAALKALVSTDIHRSIWVVCLGDGTKIEVALDAGFLRAGERSCPVHEIELELKAGKRADLFRFAASLAGDLPLRLEPEAKSFRAFRLLTGAGPERRKTTAPDMPADITAADGVRRILVAGVTALMADLATARAGNAAGVHQARVAVRRLRTALVLFKPYLTPEATSRFNDPLRDLGRILGTARDWDVFIRDLLPEALRGACSEALLANAETRHQDAVDDMVQTLDAPETTRLILALVAWTEQPDLIRDEHLRHCPLVELVPKLLSRMEHKVAKRGRHIARLSGEDLHAVRKSLKKLRYAVDDVASLFPGKAVKRYRKHCAHLQDRLGLINDAATAITLGNMLHAGEVVHWANKRQARTARKLPDKWDEFRHTHPFWN